MNKNYYLGFLLVLIILLFAGCDNVYRYVFMPSERVEQILVPNKEFIASLNDTTIKLSKDGNTIIIDKKDFKIEIKYMSDYQLNNFEFPEESKQKEFSRNPYTYGDWINPDLGYTPNRFTVFKISIYNYSGSKINFDPEEAILETDRGDKLRAYGREKKESKGMSIEEYYLKRKGKSGIDDEVFEARMGIARRTMLFYGKPIYAGDSKEGFIVFDPIVESVEFVKLSLNKFILGYDENNEPSNFATYTVYFKNVPFDKSMFENRQITELIQSTSEAKPEDKDKVTEISVVQLKYSSIETRFSGEPWNPIPNAIPNLLDNVSKSLKVKTKFDRNVIEDKVLKDAKIAILLGGFAKPDFTNSNAVTLSDYLKKGGFLFIDNAFVANDWPYYSTMTELVSMLQKNISNCELKKIPMNHDIFNKPKKLSSLPAGYDDLNVKESKTDYIEGIFINNKLVGILSNKGYVQLWASNSGNEQANDLGVNIFNYLINQK